MNKPKLKSILIIPVMLGMFLAIILAATSNQNLGQVLAIPELKPALTKHFKTGTETDPYDRLYQSSSSSGYIIQTRSVHGNIIEAWQWIDNKFKQVCYFDMDKIKGVKYTEYKNIKTDEICSYISNLYEPVFIGDEKLLSTNTNLLFRSIYSTSNYKVLNDICNYSDAWCFREYGFSNNGKYLAIYYTGDTWLLSEYESDDKPIKVSIYDIANEKYSEVATITVDTGVGKGADMAKDIICSDDGTYLALAGRAWGVTLFNVKQKKFMWENKPETCWYAKSIQITPDNERVYAGSTNGHLYEYETSTGELIADIGFEDLVGTRNEMGGIVDLAISPDGKWIAILSGHVFLYSLETRKIEYYLKMQSYIREAVFSPDSQKLAVFMGGPVGIYEIPSKCEVEKL